MMSYKDFVNTIEREKKHFVLYMKR